MLINALNTNHMTSGLNIDFEDMDDISLNQQ